MLLDWIFIDFLRNRIYNLKFESSICNWLNTKLGDLLKHS